MPTPHRLDVSDKTGSNVGVLKNPKFQAPNPARLSRIW
jgi:hypothetical protein